MGFIVWGYTNFSLNTNHDRIANVRRVDSAHVMMPPKEKKAKLQEGQLTMGFGPLGFQLQRQLYTYRRVRIIHPAFIISPPPSSPRSSCMGIPQIFHVGTLYGQYMQISARLLVSDDDQSWPWIGISPTGAARIPFRLRYLRIGS